MNEKHESENEYENESDEHKTLRKNKNRALTDPHKQTHDTFTLTLALTPTSKLSLPKRLPPQFELCRVAAEKGVLNARRTVSIDLHRGGTRDACIVKQESEILGHISQCRDNGALFSSCSAMRLAPCVWRGRAGYCTDGPRVGRGVESGGRAGWEFRGRMA